jgi:excisionase family DNA binding protein
MESTDGERREPLLSVRQAAALLGLCTATVYEHCAKGSLRHAKVASAIRIASSALQEFIQIRSLPLEHDRLRAPLLPPASSRGAADETPDSRGSRPPNDELSTHNKLPDEDSWYEPE